MQKFENTTLQNNPTLCIFNIDNKSSLGCNGIEPCESLFVKMGGEVMKSNLVPKTTILRVRSEDNKSDKERCKVYHKPFCK